MTQLVQESEIERVHVPTREAFEEYAKRNQPIVLTGVASEWPAFRDWDADYLESVAGDSLVTVHFEERGDFQRWYRPASQTDKRMPLREYLDILRAEPADRRYYMSEHDLRLVSPKLLADVDISRYSDGAPEMFLGRDTCMPLHYHATTEAVLCQLIGHKQVLLYSPAQFSKLYAHPWYSPSWMFSQIDGGQQMGAFTVDTGHLNVPAPATDQFPKFKRAVPLVVNLEPGECLYIPVHWWHLTTCPGFQVNVSFFWRSIRSRYTFPQPGMQVCARETLNKLKHSFGGKS